MKESNPVEVTKFSIARVIDKEPAFSWWVPFTLKKRNAIIAAFRSIVQRRTHKYGIEVPTYVEHALEIDRRNGNTL